MKSIKLLSLVILFSFIQTITFAQAVQINPVSPSSPDFQAELSELQIENPHLGPNHDLVYPGDIIIFDDGSQHVIQEGEYESMLLLEYLRNQNLNSDQVVSIIQTNSIQTQNNIFTWPWYVVLMMLAIVAGIIAIAYIIYQMPYLIGRLSVEHNYNNPAPELPDITLVTVSDENENSNGIAPNVTINGNNNSVAIGSNPRSKSSRNNEVEDGETE
ncbi:MAG: hypothetical protein WD095_00605 [Candidatus Paceibacterota bacterium]